MYYNLDGDFCRVENGVDYTDSNVLLKMKWWGTDTLTRADADDTLGGS